MSKRIIVVEDDTAISDVLTIILEKEEYKVDCFSDASFTHGLKDDMPGLILLDMWLSGINGKDICISLKKHQDFKHIPVIIMSANRDVKEHAEEACAEDYLAKPFDISALLTVVKKYLLV